MTIEPTTQSVGPLEDDARQLAAQFLDAEKEAWKLRRKLADLKRRQDRIRNQFILSGALTGRNETERKAQLDTMLNDDREYEALIGQQDSVEHLLFEAQLERDHTERLFRIDLALLQSAGHVH